MQIIQKVFLIFFLGWLIQSTSYAQNCSCNLNVKAEKKRFNYFLDHQQFELAQKQANRLRAHQNPSCQIIGNDFMVTIFNYQQNLDSIKVYLDKEAAILKTHTCDQRAKMEYYASLADYYMHANELEKGVAASLKSLKLSEQLKETRLEAFLLSNLCVCFNRLNQHENEINYAMQLGKLLPALEDPISKADYANTIASSYLNYFLKSKKETSLLSAKKYALQSLSLSQSNHYFEAQVHSFTILSQTSDLNEDYNTAQLYLDSALQICQTQSVYNAVYSLYEIYKEKAQLFVKQNRPKEVLKWALMTYNHAVLTKEETPVMNASLLLANAYQALNDSKNASLYFQKYIALKERFDEKQNKAVINELELKYNKVKNEQVIQKQQEKNKLLAKQTEIDSLNIRLLIGGLAFVVLLSLLVFFFLRQRSLKQRTQLLETEQRLNRSRMNPHFFFNLLASLQSFILKSDDKRASVLQLSRFSKIMRQTLESTYAENVNIHDEVQFLKEYLELQRFRKKDAFEYSIQIEEDLLDSGIKIPSMLLQPFIENAIEHGINELQTAGKIKIAFLETEHFLKVTIEDNGKGLIAEKTTNQQHVSRATQISKERMLLLNSKYKTAARFQLIDTGKGVKVEFELPLTLN